MVVSRLGELGAGRLGELGAGRLGELGFAMDVISMADFVGDMDWAIRLDFRLELDWVVAAFKYRARVPRLIYHRAIMKIGKLNAHKIATPTILYRVNRLKKFDRQYPSLGALAVYPCPSITLSDPPHVA